MNKQSFFRLLMTLLLLCLPLVVRAQQPASQPVTPAPSGNTPQTAAPSSSSGTNIAPSGNSAQGAPTEPGSNARPVTPAGQTEQGVQPTTQAEQQGRGTQPQPVTQPQTPQGGAPTTDSLPPSGAQPSAVPNIQPGQTPAVPGQNVNAPAVTRQPGRESVPAPAPAAQDGLNVPQVAPAYEAPERPLPELGRVGVDMMDQKPLSLREALELALSNNKDIEVARSNVKIAEFDLRGARGIYDPRFSSLSYYERSVTPSTNVFSGGGASGIVTQSDYTGTTRLEGLVPKYGGGYRLDFSSIRLVTTNQFAVLNPQFPTALTFSYTQPLWRGLRFDINRRQIEVAKKNLSLTDAQFRQRTSETIAAVQRAYWDLVYALRNLQIQRDAVRDARAQLEHNKRLVEEGMLAPIDVVAANAQVSGFEQSVYSALEDVSRAENNLKNLIAEDRNAPLWSSSIVPTDAVDLVPPAITLPDAMQAALENRAELKQSDVVREINELDQRYYREQTKPQVDLIGSYGVVGLSGNLNPSPGTNALTSSSELTRLKINEIIAALPNTMIQPLPPPVTQSLPDNLIGGFGQ
ncbi:MAG: TolC family protein, partial [Acidobacteria bacterium]|nr:TolC family protein [Acidobacteriota bacterium]